VNYTLNNLLSPGPGCAKPSTLSDDSTVATARVPLRFPKPKLLKIVAGMYSEGRPSSTAFRPLQALCFQKHTFPPQGSAPF
jgi:hypothetical protein